MSIFKDIGKGISDFYGGIVNPGGEDRGKAAANAKKAAQQWEDFKTQYQAGLYDSPELSVTNVSSNTGPGVLHTYDTGPMQEAVQTDFLDPGQASAAGLQGDSQYKWMGPSSWEGASSAYDAMGPSSWDSYSSEYGNLGPSAYGDLSYSNDALSRMGGAADYFANLSSGGPDAQAEADFARRTGAAEASRRANTDAALRDLETRGQGNANAGLLAELSNQQASVSDQYQAGLDANALAQARRDNAAGQGANIAGQMGNAQLTADEARARGLDTYSMQRAGGMDTAAARRAAGQDAYGFNQAAGQDTFAGNQNNALDTYANNQAQGMDSWANQRYGEYYGNQEANAGRAQATSDRNTDRAWGTMDANTDMGNNATMYNANLPQQQFNNMSQITSGAANAYGGVANTYGNNAQGSANAVNQWFDRAANVAQAAGKKAGI
jgi:hypothetical protein